MLGLAIETRLTIHFDSQDLAQQYFACLEPELKNMPQGRSNITYFAPEEGTLEFNISSSDFTAARAAYNSIVQYLRVIDDALKMATKSSGQYS
jgi:tRNA threonylcarbamoyladenosine modification (KEOPS) complex  Pcc1 subunit